MLAYPPFDVSVADIWPTLCAGGCLVVPPENILMDPDGLIAWLASEEVTLTFVPTGLAEILFGRPWPKQMKLRLFTTGGDRLRVRPPAGLPFPVLNGYGPTENTVFSTFSTVMAQAGQKQLPPIGRPVGNVKAYVLDEGLHPVPVGVPGELYLGGEQVARGYLGRPELTAERFLPDPFVNRSNGRMYRTGDWVRWLPDGELDFLGRQDDQIQIRGTRVELGEIDAALCSYEGVQQACCVPLLDNEMPASISAHIVANNNHPGFLDGLRAHLQERLPSKAVPSEYVLHDRLPLTPQGKLDRKALRPIQATQATTMHTEDALEKALALLWQATLPKAKLAEADATFQALGGDSLVAIRMMLEVEEITGQKIELSTFLLKPTFAGLCQEVRRRKSDKVFEPVIALRRQGSRPPMFCMYGLAGDLTLHLEFAEALGHDQPVWGIRSPALANLERLPASIEEAAKEVRGWIRQIQPKGVPALVGYSWGGLLAFELSRQFTQAEGISCFTALIGSDPPTRPVSWAYKSMRLASFFPRWLWGLATDSGNRAQRLANWRHMVLNAKRTLGDAAQPLPPSMPLPDWASGPIPLHFQNLSNKYQPLPRRPARIHLIRERDLIEGLRAQPAHPLRSTEAVQLEDAGWSRWCIIPPRVHWMPGDHESILRMPLVAELAQTVRRAMDEHLQLTRP
jgi:thioesterase domain-containing protein/acyl carrier protein